MSAKTQAAEPPIVGGLHYATGLHIIMEMSGGTIRRVAEAANGAAADLPILAPGLVDLQINGYRGHDFNATTVSEETVREVARMLLAEGVTSFFPTVITNSVEAITHAMSVIAGACDADPATHAAVAGIHLEGPFISAEDGARGAHDSRFVRAPDWELFCKWQTASGNRIRIVTMSPEWPGSEAFIARCVAAGVVVSIGHTSAAPEQIAAAVRGGARMSTHLGNGAHLMLPRHPNYLWEQLAQDELWACTIADGFHLPPQVMKVIMKVKGERSLLVSDAVSLCGMPAGEYTTHVGGCVVLTPEGKLHTAENEKILAGSAQMLLRGIENLIRLGLADFATAWQMASVRPARLMGLPTASGLAAGAPADFILLRRRGDQLTVESTFKSGRRVYTAPR